MSAPRKVYSKTQIQPLSSEGRDYYENDDYSYDYHDSASPNNQSAVYLKTTTRLLINEF